MKRYRKILLLSSFVFGWILLGLGYGMRIAHPINTIMLCLGLALILMGGYFVLMAMKDQ